MCLKTPALLHQRTISLLYPAPYFSPLKTLSPMNFLSPNNSLACLDIYKYSTPSVFSCRKFTLENPSSSLTSDQTNVLISDHRSPDKQENKNALFKTSYLQSVFANLCNSSKVKYSLWLSA